MQAAKQATYRVLCDERTTKVIEAQPYKHLGDERWEIQGVRSPLRLSKATMALAGESVWIGYERGGWNIPLDAELETCFVLRWKGGGKSWLYVYASASTPEVKYVIVFKTMKRFALSNGRYMGEHPCGGYAVPVEQVDAMYRETSLHHDA